MFATTIIDWYKENKRDLPWRDTKDPYKIWISEIILQQTRVVQGYDYYCRFMEHFPDVETLAKASEDEVMKCWQGLGYYSRARNLHEAARTIAETTADWKATGAWQSGESSADVPAVGSQATLTANADTTVTLNDVAALSQLTIGGAGTVKVADAQKGGLSATTATINTTVDLSEVSACLGAVTIAAGKTLTVQGGSSVLSDLTFGDAIACLKVYGEEMATPAQPWRSMGR